MPKRQIKHEIGIVVLCGGESSRMGIDKWQLPVGESTLLDHLLGQMEPHDGTVLSQGSSRPVSCSSSKVEVVEDQIPESGPLEGIRCGLKHLSNRFEFAFVTACDIPWFPPTVVEFLLQQIENHQAVIPVVEDRVYGMTAVYRTDIHPKLTEMVMAQQLKVSLLASELRTNRISKQQLQSVDPQLDSLKNINGPEDYLAYLKELGLSCPDEIAERLNRS